MRVKFADTLKIINGKNQQKVEDLQGKYPIYGSGGIMGYANDYICPAETVIIGRKGSINKPIFADMPFWNVDTAFGLCADKAKLFPKYLYYFCVNFDFERLNTTVTIPSLTKSNLLNIEIPLPPLDEQRRIAAVLDKVSDLIAKRREQLDKLDELVKARFVEMFGDPESNPKKWNLLSFREAGVRLSDGPFGSNLKSEHYTTEGVRVIRLGNIGVGQFIDNDKSYISEQHYEKLRKYTCRSGEIVIGTLGDPNLRACLVPKTIEYAINKADCVHYIPKPEILNTRFVCQYINCPETLLLASGMVHGQTRSRISSGQLAEMPIFVPPMELQEQYAAFAEQVDKSKLTIQQSLDKMETLKKALMQEYFG